jgi:outer membrane murein-binding lipoprotein Lpp
MRSTDNSGSGNLYFTAGTDSVKMFVGSSGNVGINTVTPSTTLEVVGTITCTTLVETSSVATKTNVKKLNSQTAKLSKLVPVSFNYKKDNKRSLGLIAEEVAQVYPELVEYDNGRPLGVNYSKLTAVLISTVNELAAEVAELKKQLNK